MRAAHTMNCVRLQQHPTMKSMHNALPFRSSGNFQARPQLAGISSSKIGSSSSSSDKVVVLDASDRQIELAYFRGPKSGKAVLSALNKLAGAGVLKSREGEVLLPAGTDVLQPGEYLYQRQGVPTRYKNITVHIAGDSFDSQVVLNFGSVNRAALEALLIRRGADTFLDPVTKRRVDFSGIELSDNMLLSALRGDVPLEARVSTIEGIVRSSVRSFEGDATEAVYQGLRKQHSRVKVLDIRELTAADGSKREVDGVVVADGCAAIVEAKQQLDDSAVPQLASCLEFIRVEPLTGPAAELKGKKLLGYLAGKTLTSDPGKVKQLLRNCELHDFRILLSSGMSLTLENSRVKASKQSTADEAGQAQADIWYSGYLVRAAKFWLRRFRGEA